MGAEGHKCTTMNHPYLAQDENLLEIMENIRGRFKAVASMMGCLQDYFPRAKESAEVDPGLGPVKASTINF